MAVDLHNPTDKQRANFRALSWGWKWKLIHARAEGRCELCRHRAGRQVHHKTYIRKGHEDIDDLALVCRYCHEEIHGRVGGVKTSILSDHIDPDVPLWPQNEQERVRMAAASDYASDLDDRLEREERERCRMLGIKHRPLFKVGLYKEPKA